jgi:hypothetical protein
VFAFKILETPILNMTLKDTEIATLKEHLARLQGQAERGVITAETFRESAALIIKRLRAV